MVQSTSPSTAQLAADKLWQFQLRKEHKTLLEQIRENERKSVAVAAESEKKNKANEEKINALETKIIELEQQQLKKNQEQEQQRGEQMAYIAQMRKEMRAFLQARGNVSGDDIRAIVAGQARSNSPNSQHGPSAPSKQNHPTKDSSSRRPRPVLMPRTSDEERHLATEGPAHRNGTLNHHKNGQNARRPVPNANNRSGSKTSDLIPDVVDAFPFNTTFPRLAQGTTHMRTYYGNSTEIFRSLGTTDEPTEIDFVNTFIKGITASKVREKLLAHLQQIHPSKNRKGGIEVLCDWLDVEEGLKKTGLLEEKETDPGRKKRNLNPRGLIETSFHH